MMITQKLTTSRPKLPVHGVLSGPPTGSWFSATRGRPFGPVRFFSVNKAGSRYSRGTDGEGLSFAMRRCSEKAIALAARDACEKARQRLSYARHAAALVKPSFCVG